MLTELAIKNFAIIDDVKISFTDGLNILSGETGAGKSVIVNSVKLLLGLRSSFKDIRDGAESAVIEALFELKPNSSLLKKIKEIGYLDENNLLIKRIISKNKNQIYINGSIASLNILSDITKSLFEISSQHAYQLLLKEENHLLILDSYANIEEKREFFSGEFKTLLNLIEEKKKLQKLIKEKKDKLEFLNFQKEEIESAKIEDVSEDLILENEKKQLKYGAMLYETVYSVKQSLYEKEGAILEQVIGVKEHLSKAVGIDNSLSDFEKKLNDICFTIEDILGGLNKYISNTLREDKKLEEVEERLNILQKIKRKYGGTLQEVLEYYDKISSDFNQLDSLDSKLEEIEKRIVKHYEKVCQLADELSYIRNKSKDKLSEAIEKELALLEMSDAKFEIVLNNIKPEENIDRYLINKGFLITDKGMETATFMIAANFGEKLKNLKSVASGGELSRIVLAIKSILAEKDSVATIVFDEADAGIGGETAEKLGEKMFSLAKSHQVICITHLHQIAKFAQSHFKITKKVKDERTVTRIKLLNEEDRVNEIARMLSGKEITETTKKYAKEILN